METVEEKKIDDKIVKPFLRWTGSKKWLIKNHLDDYLPAEFNNYHEPFLGGGCVFLHIKPEKTAFLSDANAELINTYIQIRDNLENLIKALSRLKNTKEEYYRIRDMNLRDECKSAARFIYLNRTSFNGIYRVNDKGKYNVPYGNRTNVDIVTSENLKKVSNALVGVNLTHTGFGTVLRNIQKNDLVYLDPPYTVAHENNGFIEYNSKLFSWNDQKRLARLVREISEIGAYFILSNAEHLEIRNLYQGLGTIDSLSRYSKVGGRNKTRGIFNEIIITNTK